MLDKIFRLSPDDILKSGPKINDYLESDAHLRKLGPIDQPIIAFNPNIDEKDHNLIYWVDNLEIKEKCIVLNYNNQCLAKIFPPFWQATVDLYQEIDITKPSYIWKKNLDLDRLMSFKNDPLFNFEHSPWDKDYELVWYLDPRVNPTDDKIWAMSCRPEGRKILGQKNMGYLMPDIDVEFNPELPKFNFDVDNHYPPYWDLAYENVYELDPKHHLEENLWAVKYTPNYRKSKGWRVVDVISPDMKIEYNPVLGEMDYDIEHRFLWHDFEHEMIWLLDREYLEEGEEDIWAFKIKLSENIKGTKILGHAKPNYDVTYNTSVGNLNYDIEQRFFWHDFAYEHVWYLDRKHMEEGEEDIWAFKLKLSKNVKGSKHCGYISPSQSLKFNKDISQLNYDIDCENVKWYNLAYEHVWYLDRKHMEEGEEDIWALKLKFSNKPKGSKNLGYVSPVTNIEYNSILEKLNYEIDYENVKWYDLAYEHVWYLDRKHMEEGEEDIWTLKFNFTDTIKGTKTLGYHSPLVNVEYNRSLPNFNFNLDYAIPWYDLNYKHIWYLEQNYSKSKEKIWIIKLSAIDNAKGEKEVGTVIPQISNQLDVIFISYNEPNAEKNWRRVLEKAPWAKRVQGVKGIFNAHKEAARLSQTDMFYVVDGDAWLMDEWEFNYQPGIFDRDCAYVWASKNPINDLVYQNGGVKLFSKSILMKQKKWTTLDMFTGIMPKIKSEDAVSCITSFNVDPFSTWRSAFRECVKLYVTNQMNKLNIWIKKGRKRKFGKYAIDGAIDAENFAKQHANNYNELLKINDYSWLEKKFKEKYPNV